MTYNIKQTDIVTIAGMRGSGKTEFAKKYLSELPVPFIIYDLNCLAEDTIIDGKKIQEICIGDVINSQNVVDKKEFIAEEVLKLTFNNGSEIVCTKNHKFPFRNVNFNGKKRAETNDLVTALNMRYSDFLSTTWKDTELNDFFILLGIFHAKGDSYQRLHGRTSNAIRFSINQNEIELKTFILNTLTKYFPEAKIGIYSYKEKGMTIGIYSEKIVNQFMNKYSSLRIKDMNELELRSFLKGFYEGDGYVNIARNSIVFSQNKDVHRKFVLDALDKLNYKYYNSETHFWCSLPQNEKNGMKTWERMNNTELNTNESLRFIKEIGFISTNKRNKFCTKLIEKELIKKSIKVYDITLDGDHTYYANNIRTHNSEYISQFPDNTYVPKTEEAEEFSKFCEAIWKRGNMIIIIDEAEQILTEHKPLPPYAAQIVRRGRHRGIGMVVITRRPAELSKTVISLSNYVILFRFFLPNDVKYLSEFIGSAAEKLPSLPDYHFMVYNRGKTTIHKPIKMIS